ncbi:lysophospholipid acyltransferase family protein [Singulisphaera sp. Ch08]|uniref:Lysophospholipid acyltransferase family protein n=1 Tax=Singulisphaera sp. Ch08 TaxID=3120278 RepID=A0AAU7CRI2_9BACT
MRRRRPPLLDYAVYLGVRLIVGVAQALSIEQSYAFARFLAAILYRVDKRHRKVGMDNLEIAFGDLYTDVQRDQIVRDVYRHFCMMLMEILHIPRKLHPTTWRDRITLVGEEKLQVLDRLLNGGPVIMLTGHYGNWEMAGYLFGVFGFPPNSVARALDNPYLDQFLKSFRERTGQKMIPKTGGYDEMLEVLRSGKLLSFLADQDAGQNGMFVDFFGRPASTHKAIALLAIEHHAPVIVGYARRVGPGFRYEVGCDVIIDPDELTGTADDARLITQRFTTALEMIIRRDPSQYLWLHRRWKHQPKKRGNRKAAEVPNAPESGASG